MPKKILVVYYSQTGQLLEITHSVLSPLSGDENFSITYEVLRPQPPFPFPWSSDEFFQAMPESVQGIPCVLKPLSVTGKEDFDLIVIAWQPWFLSPSIPIHAFFQLPVARELINGKPVITIIGSRNMWVMAQKQIKKYIYGLNGRLVGNIVLFDKAANLLSVVSVIRWMFKGKKERYLKIIPPAGVAPEDIMKAPRFGNCLKEALINGDMSNLDRRLISLGAVEINPGNVMIEKRGIVLFRLWARFILHKGQHGSKDRIFRVRLFKYYLLAVLYLVSPFASILYIILKPFRKRTIEKQISLYQSNDHE